MAGRGREGWRKKSRKRAREWGKNRERDATQFPGFKHVCLYYRIFLCASRFPRWPATYPIISFSKSLDRGKNHRIIPSWSVLLSRISACVNIVECEHVSDRSIGKRDDSMTISALLFSRQFRSFCCVIYVDRSLSNFLFLLLFLLNCWKV